MLSISNLLLVLVGLENYNIGYDSLRYFGIF